MTPTLRLAIVVLCLLCSGAQARPAKKKAAAPTVAAALAAPALAGAIHSFDAKGAGMGHPRLFKGQPDYAGIVAATRAERARAIAALSDTLKRHPVSAVAAQVQAQLGADQATRMAGWWQQDRLLEGMAESAFAWYVTRDDWFLAEMRARMQLFGPSVLRRDCSGDVSETRDYVWYFALAYDFAYPAMRQEERDMVGDVIVACASAAPSCSPSPTAPSKTSSLIRTTSSSARP